VPGANKSATIQGQELLRWYFEMFKQALADPLQLVIVGYGFRDPDINQVLLESARVGPDWLVLPCS
jgi:hypothetical protein